MTDRETPPPPPPGNLSPAEWHIARGQQQRGPLTREQIISAIKSEQLNESDYLWKKGMAQWVPLASLPEFAKHLAIKPPPVPAQAAESQELSPWGPDISLSDLQSEIASQQRPQEQTENPAPSKQRFDVAHGKERFKPLMAEQVVSMIREGKLLPSDLATDMDEISWKPLEELPSIREKLLKAGLIQEKKPAEQGVTLMEIRRSAYPPRGKGREDR
ncbi:MAG: DUF4339 domain-containing protein [Candidatus Sumerlaeota bacterium]|nr:DUF4339 domain-containing protein [Candidatus Sumerlaeota bacterium]